MCSKECDWSLLPILERKILNSLAFHSDRSMFLFMSLLDYTRLHVKR